MGSARTGSPSTPSERPLSRSGSPLDEGTTAPPRMRIGVLGCGLVSHMYLPNLVESPIVDLVAIADLDSALAEQVGRQYGVRAVAPDALLEDASVELVVNLTPIHAHVDTTRRLLEAGKHVYTEKSLAPTYPEARALADEADRRGLVLAAAPDTLLGSGFSAARAELDAGAIGRPAFASAVMVRGRVNEPSWYTAGATPLLDMAPYYVTALVSLFGSAVEVTARSTLWQPGEKPVEASEGAQLGADAIIRFASGATAMLTLAWTATTPHPETTRLDVFGAEGIIHFPNPNNFGDPAFLTRYGTDERSEIADSRQPEALRANLRGLGIAEAAQAIREGRQPRCSAHLAAHVVEIITAIAEAGETRAPVAITSRAERPRPLAAQGRNALLPTPVGVGRA